MRNMTWPKHGGQPDNMLALLKMRETHQVLDFSANLNPLGPPVWLTMQQAHQFSNLTSYPDPEYHEARRAIAEHVGLHGSEVLLTNGGAEAIYLTAKLFEGQKALIVHPTFSEYEQACQHYHLSLTEVSVDEQGNLPLPQILDLIEHGDVRVLYLCRPNNPTGVLYPQEQIALILEQAKHLNVTCVIDEAFIDFLPHDEHLTQWIHRYPVILLRSMTKIYTVPGLRIGYMLATALIIRKLREFQMPWSVNSVASVLVPKLLEDHEFVVRTHQWLKEEWDYLQQHLSLLGYSFLPTLTNFYLLFDHDQHHTDQQNLEELQHKTALWFRFLVEQGILARHTLNFKGLDGQALRFAIRSRAENHKLIQALTRWREES